MLNSYMVTSERYAAQRQTSGTGICVLQRQRETGLVRFTAGSGANRTGKAVGHLFHRAGWH
jgi:hypothetical protein